MALMSVFKMHLRMGGGGYVDSYHILDGDKVVGTTTTIKEPGAEKSITTHVLHATQQPYVTARDFIEAYQGAPK